MATIKFAFCFLTMLLLKAYGADDESANVSQADADDYLEKYGYLTLPKQRNGNPALRAIARQRAIADFQGFANLPQTGKLDADTKRMMLAPRCGVSDKKGRAAFYSKWNKNHITWTLTRPTGQLSEGMIRRALKEAFDVWSSVTPLNFTEVSAAAKPDMVFEFGTGDHGDYYKFDGNGGVLAHAFFPSDGRLHFDDDEKWCYNDADKIKEGSYTDLLSVAIHELGHSLGLPHSNEEAAIMFPFYRHPDLTSNGQIKQFQLSGFDIAAIQEAYGSRDGATLPPGVTLPATTTRAPEVTPSGGGSSGATCSRFDAAVTGIDGATYFIQGTTGWKKNSINDAPNAGNRFYVYNKFPGFPSNGQVTAALTDRGAQYTILFYGRRFFVYTWKSSIKAFELMKDLPSELGSDVPFEPTGAFQSKEGHVILTRGNDFVMWSPNSNQVFFKSLLSNYFENFITNTPSFSVGEDKLYFLVNDKYSVYDLKDKKIVSTAPVKQLITC